MEILKRSHPSGKIEIINDNDTIWSTGRENTVILQVMPRTDSNCVLAETVSLDAYLDNPITPGYVPGWGSQKDNDQAEDIEPIKEEEAAVAAREMAIVSKYLKEMTVAEVLGIVSDKFIEMEGVLSVAAAPAFMVINSNASQGEVLMEEKLEIQLMSKRPMGKYKEEPRLPERILSHSLAQTLIRRKVRG